MRFRDLPLKNKMMLIIGLTVGAGLLISTLLFAASEIDDNREAELAKLNGMAEILAASSTAAIAFDDAAAAGETLAGLRARPEVVAGSITLRTVTSSRTTLLTSTPVLATRPGATSAIAARRLLGQLAEDRVPDPPGQGSHRHAEHRIRPAADVARHRRADAGRPGRRLGRLWRRPAPCSASATLGLGADPDSAASECVWWPPIRTIRSAWRSTSTMKSAT
jgi:hypothetical protein